LGFPALGWQIGFVLFWILLIESKILSYLLVKEELTSMLPNSTLALFSIFRRGEAESEAGLSFFPRDSGFWPISGD
jgi:hypothetical protein